MAPKLAAGSGTLRDDAGASVASTDYNDPTFEITGHTLYNPSSAWDTGIGSMQFQELERQVYNEAGGPSHVGPRILGAAAVTFGGPVAIADGAPAAISGANYVRQNTSFDGSAPAFLKYGDGRVFGVRWKRSQPIFRLDYQFYTPSDQSRKRLHFHLFGSKTHYSIDPRSFFD